MPTVLHLDCICQQVQTFKVNGKIIEKPQISGEFIYIPKDLLVVGPNFITVHYKNIYNNDGLGCMSFK